MKGSGVGEPLRRSYVFNTGKVILNKVCQVMEDVRSFQLLWSMNQPAITMTFASKINKTQLEDTKPASLSQNKPWIKFKLCGGVPDHLNLTPISGSIAATSAHKVARKTAVQRIELRSTDSLIDGKVLCSRERPAVV